MSDAKVYVVFRQGVYRHELLGVFDQADDAARCADKVAADDTDSYHSYDVLAVTMNRHVEDGPVVHSARKAKEY